MRLEICKIITDQLIRHHQLDRFPEWTVEYSSGLLRTAGQCSRRTRTIQISTAYIELQQEDEEGEAAIREIVLHEIAHALLKDGRHDSKWKALAILIGASGQTNVPDWVRKPVGPYRLRCRECGLEYDRFRKPSKPMGCGECEGKRSRSRRMKQ